jgi:uncharacterized membrane protein
MQNIRLVKGLTTIVIAGTLASSITYALTC